MFDEKAVFKELCRARAATVLRPQHHQLGHRRPMLVLQMTQQKRILQKRNLAQVTLVQSQLLSTIPGQHFFHFLLFILLLFTSPGQ